MAQPPKATVGSWLILLNQINIHKKWSISPEFQYRSYELTPNTEQLMMRIGANHHISTNYIATLGYAFVPNYAFDKNKDKGFQVVEHRIWQQFLIRHSLDRIILEQRYRLEQRWLKSFAEQNYLNRVRLLLRVTVPINNKEIKQHTLFFTAYNELFIHFNATPFDRNRIFTAIGYQFLPQLNIQLGYLGQTLNNTTRHFLQTTMAFSVLATKRKI